MNRNKKEQDKKSGQMFLKCVYFPWKIFKPQKVLSKNFTRN